MEGKYTEKLEARQASSQEVLDTTKSLDGTDRQINERLPLDGSQPMEGLITLPFAPGIGTDVTNKAYVDSQDTAVVNYAQNAANVAQANATAVATNAQQAANQAQVSANQGINQAAVASNQAGNALGVAQNAQQSANQAYNVGNHNHPYASSKHVHSASEIKGLPKLPARTGPGNAAAGHTHTI